MSTEKSKKYATITMEEHDGSKTSCNTLRLEILKEGLDVIHAVRAACKEYAVTQEGLETWEYTCANFNWGDFAEYVPNKICEKHGFRKADFADTADYVVDFNECLVEEPEFNVTDIQWDTDGEEISELPKEVVISVYELLRPSTYPGVLVSEKLADVTVAELKDRIADYLTDAYGFCVKSFAVN